ncbi:hypothetical protein L484_010077 [Morus notabilis]|uniref:Peptidoglycan binding-like domain-containing protein n=1 Tax=Morus notabilis TaxID=981085 RepID=W9RET8_9ROSA|nr:hypothetical protein L484_010077 [Morus notabilis]
MCSSSSSFPLFLNPPIHHKPRPLFPSATFSSSSRSLGFKSFLCFSSDPSQFDRREVLWLREEQRWLREEQRWLREEQRWARERDSLLRRIANLERRIQAMQGSEAVAGVAALVQALKDQSRIAESGTSASPIVLEEKKSAEDEEREKEMVVVEKVVRVSDGEAAKTTGKKKRSALRMGSEGEEVRAMQEALEKLGFYSGEEDIEYSSFSTGTERAVKTWQASLGAREDGIVSEELLERLFMEQTQGVSSNKNAEPKEGANGSAITSVTEISNVQQTAVKDEGVKGVEVSKHRVYLLGENRWEEPSRLGGRDKKVDDKSTSKCHVCRGEGRLMCTGTNPSFFAMNRQS